MKMYSGTLNAYEMRAVKSKQVIMNLTPVYSAETWTVIEYHKNMSSTFHSKSEKEIKKKSFTCYFL